MDCYSHQLRIKQTERISAVQIFSNSRTITSVAIEVAPLSLLQDELETRVTRGSSLWSQSTGMHHFGMNNSTDVLFQYEFNLLSSFFGFKGTFDNQIVSLAPIEFICTEPAFSVANKPIVFNVPLYSPDTDCFKQAGSINTLISDQPPEVKYRLNNMDWKERAASEYCALDL